MDETNIGSCGQLGAEELVIVVEQIYRAIQSVAGIFQAFIYQYIQIELFVSPVYFEKRLESRDKVSQLREGAFENALDYFWMISVKWICLDPLLRVELA